MNLILDHRRELAEKHILQLEDRRKSLASKIQAVHEAMTFLAGEEKAYTETVELCTVKGRKSM